MSFSDETQHPLPYQHCGHLAVFFVTIWSYRTDISLYDYTTFHGHCTLSRLSRLLP
jgi:hypothetical protein